MSLRGYIEALSIILVHNQIIKNQNIYRIYGDMYNKILCLNWISQSLTKFDSILFFLPLHPRLLMIENPSSISYGQVIFLCLPFILVKNLLLLVSWFFFLKKKLTDSDLLKFRGLPLRFFFFWNYDHLIWISVEKVMPSLPRSASKVYSKEIFVFLHEIFLLIPFFSKK